MKRLNISKYLSASASPNLGNKIAVVLAIKLAGLFLIWFLFVRDQRVPVDAHSTASAFGLLDVKTGSNMKLEGNRHGQ